MQVPASNKVNSRLIAGSVVLFIAFLWLYYPVISGMVSEWYSNPNHSHGFLIPIISGYFVWIKRESLKNVQLRPANSGVLLILGGLILHLLGNLGAAYTTSRVSMLVVLAGLILFVYGKDLFKGISLPFFFLFFMIPMPRYLYDAVAFPLKLLVTKYSVLLLNSMGILVIREGNLIMLENVTLQVVEACSGIRSLTSIIVVGLTMACLTQKSIFARSALVLLTIPVAIGANILRIVITGLLAKSYGSSVAEGFFHEFAGLAVFGLEIVMLVILAFAMNRIGSRRKF